MKQESPGFSCGELSTAEPSFALCADHLALARDHPDLVVSQTARDEDPRQRILPNLPLAFEVDARLALGGQPKRRQITVVRRHGRAAGGTLRRLRAAPGAILYATGRAGRGAVMSAERAPAAQAGEHVSGAERLAALLAGHGMRRAERLAAGPAGYGVVSAARLAAGRAAARVARATRCAALAAAAGMRRADWLAAVAADGQMLQAERGVALHAAPDVIGAEGSGAGVAAGRAVVAGRLASERAGRQRRARAGGATDGATVRAAGEMGGADGVTRRADVPGARLAAADRAVRRADEAAS